jgi:hypothetical protein
MSSESDLPTDDSLTPDRKQTGGIPLGMQAGAKAGGDVVDRTRSDSPAVPEGEFADRSDELEDAAVGDSRGTVTRVAGSEADAIGGDSIGDDGDPPSPLTGRTDSA